jgi:hypothetical protein
VGIGVDADLLETVGLLARQRVELGDAFQLFPEEGQLPRPVLEVRGPDLHAVAAHAEGPALKRLIVAAVLLGHEIGHDLALVIFAPRVQVLRHRAVGLDRADAVDAGDRGHDDHVVAFQKRPGRRVAHPVDLFVDLGFLLDIGVRPRT